MPIPGTQAATFRIGEKIQVNAEVRDGWMTLETGKAVIDLLNPSQMSKILLEFILAEQASASVCVQAIASVLTIL